MKMTESIFAEIINTAQDCVFWKDKERRFVGVNQAFLDFYGFDSEDILIGKTDEDMGWHSDPEPFMQDELKVLQGESTYKVQGTCIIRGEERDIIASKRPIYDGDEIVGLAGSFVDVTDVVHKRTETDHAQVMYSREQLHKYTYFDKLLDETRIEDILDPLTGIISRGYILEFVKSLIAAGTPFSFIILDLDNFKFINDNYGHHSGDCVLMDVSKGLVELTDGYGVVGRFGGDELLIVNLRDIVYQDKKLFFEEMYEEQSVLRKNVVVDDNSLFITGTSGCASYPDDADNYDELFLMIDKTLYRGKSKGRNCYIIYVEEKHRDIEIQKLARRGIYSCMQSLIRSFELVPGFENKLKSVMPLLVEELHISDLYYVGKGGRMYSVLDKGIAEDVGDIDKLMKDELFVGNGLDLVKRKSPLLYAALKKARVGAVVIVRIGKEMETDGYLVCAEPRSRRIWQEDECGILYFLAKLLASYLELTGERIPE